MSALIGQMPGSDDRGWLRRSVTTRRRASDSESDSHVAAVANPDSLLAEFRAAQAAAAAAAAGDATASSNPLLDSLMRLVGLLFAWYRLYLTSFLLREC